MSSLALLSFCFLFFLTTSEGRFYLVLKRLSEMDEGESEDSASLGVSGSGNNMDGSTDTCFRSSDRVACSCGDNLRITRVHYQEILNATCSRFSIIKDYSSPFSFCASTLRNVGPGYEIHMENISEAPKEVTSFDNSSLEESIRDIERNLRVYKEVLDRTVVHVLILTREAKCFCFDNYKKWLCTTKLPFYEKKTDSVRDNCKNESYISVSPKVSITQLKPCISICYKVLQSCPYYSPFRYQKQDKEVVYGGYPAFDCPRRSNDTKSQYNFDCEELDLECTRKGGASCHDSNRLLIVISIFLFLLIIRTIR